MNERGHIGVDDFEGIFYQLRTLHLASVVSVDMKNYYMIQ